MTWGKLVIGALLSLLSVVQLYRKYRSAVGDAATAQANDAATEERLKSMDVAEAKARAAREGKFDAEVDKADGAAAAADLLRDVSGGPAAN